MARVLVAMSGGVDSAVAAARLVADGHAVTGVHLRLADLPGQLPGHGCCTLDDAQDARRAAQTLGIPFYVWDLADTFSREVREPFAERYAAGRTPNPCIDCNAHVKYSGLLRLARERGDIRADEAVRDARQLVEVDRAFQRHSAGVDAEDLAPSALVGHADHDLAVEAARTAQRLVDRVGPVGGGDHHEVGALFQPVHQGEELGD